jgi:hypothetical protein
MYILHINALYEGGRDTGSTPYLTGFPRAEMSYMSGVITVTGTGSMQGGPAGLVVGGDANRKLNMKSVRERVTR